MIAGKSLVSVIFSFRNEEYVLRELIVRCENVFKNLDIDYELIFIDDASTDSSLEILLAERKRNPKIRILKMTQRFGVMPCYMAGFDHARGDAVVMMDCDLQDPPEIIPRMIAKWREGAHVVHTVRTKRKGENIFRMGLTIAGYWIWKLLIPVDLLINSGDFRLLSRKAVAEVVKIRTADPFFRGITRSLRLSQEVVAYERDPRYAGKTHFPMSRSLEPLKSFLAVILYYRIKQPPIQGPLYRIENQYGFSDQYAN